MAFSNMTSKEKTIVAVLGVVILIALIGIGILVARLITGGDADSQSPDISVAPTTDTTTTTQGDDAGPGSAGEATITAVAPPDLEEPDELPPAEVSEQPVVAARAESPGPLSPVIIASHPLYAGHRYRVEITAADGSKVAIQGSWSQAATSASGEVAAPEIEFFEGTTPYQVNVVSPVADPSLWSVSVSAGPKDLLGQPPGLVITIWDVTGVE